MFAGKGTTGCASEREELGLYVPSEQRNGNESSISVHGSFRMNSPHASMHTVPECSAHDGTRFPCVHASALIEGRVGNTGTLESTVG